MRLSNLLIITLTFSILSSCNDKPKIKKVNYGSSKAIDSIIRAIPQSVDTLFLGFTTGMTKSEYKKHIHKLRGEGKTINYSSSNGYRSYLLGEVKLGAGYTFETNIALDVTKQKTITGYGKYFLEPIYTKEKKTLAKLNIVRFEKWINDESGNWLEHNIYKNSKRFKDKDLKKALENNKIIRGNFIREKGNLVIYGDATFVTYISKRSLLHKLFLEVRVKELVIESDKKKDIKF